MATIRTQQVPAQWSATQFAAPSPAPRRVASGRSSLPAASAQVQAQPSRQQGGPVSGTAQGKSVAAPGSRLGPPGPFQNASSFNFFQVPPMPSQLQGSTHSSGYTTNAPAASLPSFPSEYSEAPLAHSASYASCNSNDAQEALHLHPNMKNIKKPVAFEADHSSILHRALGGTLATEMPVAGADRQGRQQHNLQKTESQIIQVHAQALALQEQRRSAQVEAQAQKGPSPIRTLLLKRQRPQKIYLMRHGESEANISRRDVPDPNLTKLGLAQAKSWQETVGNLEADIVLVSPLRRAVQTALHAFQYEETPMIVCRFAREIGWACNENTVHSTNASMHKMLETLPRGDELYGVEEGLHAGPDDPATEMESLQRLKMVIASRPEDTIVVVCHFGTIAATSGCRAKNGDVYECDWGYNDELRVVARHKTPLADQQCLCS